MTEEKFYSELQRGVVERFQSLSTEDQNIIRIIHNNNEEYTYILHQVLGDSIMNGLPKLRSTEEQKEWLREEI